MASHRLAPQPGPQTRFLETKADIAIFGGSAGGGKSYALLFEALRHFNNPKFSAVYFRRESPEISNPGGLWDESIKLYGQLGARAVKHRHLWLFPRGMTVQMSHLQYEQDKESWKGAQVPLFCFDELTSFTESQFFYMLSRNRSTSGVPGYIRASTNPDADSWVRRFIDWWIDPLTGLPIAERDGVLRWFIRDGDRLVWGNSRDELTASHPEQGPHAKSVTFIRSRLEDNPALTQADPSYIASLMALPRVDRMRLLDGNWNVRPVSGMFFRREWFAIIDSAPADLVQKVRFWDRAATEGGEKNDADWTAGIWLGKDKAGVFYVMDMRHGQHTPLGVDKLIHNTATQDGTDTTVGVMQDPGSAGKYEAGAFARQMAGFMFRVILPSGDKATRAKPASSQCEAGNVKLVRGPWNETFLQEVEAFPEAKHDDIVDAFSGAFEILFKRHSLFAG